MREAITSANVGKFLPDYTCDNPQGSLYSPTSDPEISPGNNIVLTYVVRSFIMDVCKNLRGSVLYQAKGNMRAGLFCMLDMNLLQQDFPNVDHRLNNTRRN
jgi:hypothetical protein